MAYVLAVDAGTTGIRTIAFDESARILGQAYRELTQHYPQPGWVEHDADEIWDLVAATLAEVEAGVEGAPAAISLTVQRETTVAWDRRTGTPLHRAIVWQDRRTADRCGQLADAGHLPLVRERTGLVLDPYFSGTKLEWLFTHGGVPSGPEVAVGTVDSWLLWQLTGGAVHATDTTNASRTMLMDLATLDWDDELCDLLGVPGHVLPDIRPSSGRFGTTVADGPVGAGVPISGVAGDQQASLFGQACFEPGMTKNTYGTGSFVLMNVGHDVPEPVDGLLTTVAWTLGSDARGSRPGTTYALEGAIFVTGAAIQWLRDELRVIDEAAQVGPLAESVADAGGTMLVPAFTGLGSPWWDPYARGTWLGISRGTGRAQLARAVVESMAYATRDVVDAMTGAARHDVAALRVDGGASAMDLLLQLVADQVRVPVARSAVQDTTALGSALLAGLAEGVWSSLDEVAATWRSDAEFGTSADAASADSAYSRWLEAVRRSQGWSGRS
jgi:glycerol kinase